MPRAGQAVLGVAGGDAVVAAGGALLDVDQHAPAHLARTRPARRARACASSIRRTPGREQRRPPAPAARRRRGTARRLRGLRSTLGAHGVRAAADAGLRSVAWHSKQSMLHRGVAVAALRRSRPCCRARCRSPCSRGSRRSFQAVARRADALVHGPVALVLEQLHVVAPHERRCPPRTAPGFALDRPASARAGARIGSAREQPSTATSASAAPANAHAAAQHGAMRIRTRRAPSGCSRSGRRPCRCGSRCTGRSRCRRSGRSSPSPSAPCTPRSAGSRRRSCRTRSTGRSSCSASPRPRASASVSGSIRSSKLPSASSASA